MKLFLTGHSCRENAVVSDRYWLVDPSKQIFKHLGTGDLNTAFLKTILIEFKIEVVTMYIPDDAFKNFLLELGYTQS